MSTRALPYGYRMENGIILVDEEEAGQIRKIFELRTGGTGVYAIGKMLFKEQIPFFTDTRDKSIKKVSAILYKVIYTGDGKYPAIIDRQTFDKVQKMKAKPFRKRKPPCVREEAVQEYIFIPDAESSALKCEINELIGQHRVTSVQVRGMIIDLAAELYSCIRPKGETL